MGRGHPTSNQIKPRELKPDYVLFIGKHIFPSLWFLCQTTVLSVDAGSSPVRPQVSLRLDHICIGSEPLLSVKPVALFHPGRQPSEPDAVLCWLIYRLTGTAGTPIWLPVNFPVACAPNQRTQCLSQ